MAYYQRKLSKKHANEAHTKRRAKQRLGMNMNTVDIRLICQKIRNGETKHLERTSNTRMIHEVEYKDRRFAAVYDKNTHTLVTVMPLEWFDKI